MAKPKLVPLSALQAAAGGRSRQTIDTWVNVGLIPPPMMTRGESGRGRRGVWPASVLEQVRFIVEQTERGLTLSQVLMEQWKHDQPQRDEVMRRVKRIAKRWERPVPQSARRNWTRADHANLKNKPMQDLWIAGIASILMSDVDLSAAKAYSLARRTVEPAILQQALYLQLLGLEPILLISRGHLGVTSSVLVGLNHSAAHRHLAIVKRRVDDSGVKRREGLDQLGRVTIQLHGLVRECLILSGDASRGYEQHFVIPEAVAAEFKTQHIEHFVRYTTENLSLLQNGLITGELISHEVHNTPQTIVIPALKELESELEADLAARTQTHRGASSTTKTRKTRRKTKKASGQRAHKRKRQE